MPWNAWLNWGRCLALQANPNPNPNPTPNPNPNPNPSPNPNQVLAAPLVRALAAAPGLRAFIGHAHEMRREYKVDSEG